MSKIVNQLYQQNTTIYKVILFLLTVSVIVYLFPKGGQFKYDFNKGKPWQHENLLATFDFAIRKTSEEIETEKKSIRDNAKLYFVYDSKTPTDVVSNYKSKQIPCKDCIKNVMRDKNISL